MPSLKAILKKAGDMKCAVDLMREQLDEKIDEAQERFDARSEKSQESESGELAQAKIDLLISARDAADCGELDGVIEALEEIFN